MSCIKTRNFGKLKVTGLGYKIGRDQLAKRAIVVQSQPCVEHLSRSALKLVVQLGDGALSCYFAFHLERWEMVISLEIGVGRVSMLEKSEAREWKVQLIDTVVRNDNKEWGKLRAVTEARGRELEGQTGVSVKHAS